MEVGHLEVVDHASHPEHLDAAAQQARNVANVNIDGSPAGAVATMSDPPVYQDEDGSMFGRWQSDHQLYDRNRTLAAPPFWPFQQPQ